MKQAEYDQYRVCVSCVMDTSDSQIYFDEVGRCNHCLSYEELVRTHVVPSQDREARLEQVIELIRQDGVSKEYDCIIGVSGGVDSSYLAHVVVQLGLRPLAIHLDNGWNSNLAVNNIERLVTKLGIDLYTEVLDWPQFRDLQIAFLQSSTPDLEIPTDHAIEAVLMSQAKLHGIKYVLGGSNIRTEGILPSSWSQGIRDWRYIRSVHEQFGSIPIDSFPHFNVAGFITWRLRGHRKINLLNFIDYNKSTATRVLETELDWLPYGTKHGESVYTRFFQNYILPKKFGYDKRRAHLSALVCAGEIGRADALTALETPPALPEEIQQDREFVARKLGFGVERLDSVLALPNRTMSDYPNYESTWWYQILQSIYRLPRVLRRPRR